MENKDIFDILIEKKLKFIVTVSYMSFILEPTKSVKIYTIFARRSETRNLKEFKQSTENRFFSELDMTKDLIKTFRKNIELFEIVCKNEFGTIYELKDIPENQKITYKLQKRKK
jgi:hypothetical protein